MTVYFNLCLYLLELQLSVLPQECHGGLVTRRLYRREDSVDADKLWQGLVLCMLEEDN